MAGNGDEVFRSFMQLCRSVRAAKGSKGATGIPSCVERLQSFLSSAASRQLVHKWRSWGYLLNSVLSVVKLEMGIYLNLGTTRKRKAGTKPRQPQLHYWHYLRTELQSAHAENDGPLLHLDPNGRECIFQLFNFCEAVLDAKSTAYERDVEIRVEKEAWLTVEELVQYRVYCAVLEKKQWEDVLELALGSFTRDPSGSLIGDNATAPARARVVRFLLRNCMFDLDAELPGLVQEMGEWFEAAKNERIDNSDSLLLVVASSLLEMLTDLMRAYFGSIGPLILKNGMSILQFIGYSNKARKNGLRGAPAEFIMQFLKLYRFNTEGVSYFKYLSPATMLRELASLNHIVLGADEMNSMIAYARSARDRRMGALGIDDQGIQHLACAADIVFNHDLLVSQLAQGNLAQPEENELLTQVSVGSKRPRSVETALAWETVVECFFECPRTETQYATSGSFSLGSQRLSSSGRYGSQSKRGESKSPTDPGSWLLLLLSILTRHGHYYVANRIGDLMMVMQKLGEMLVVKELGKPQSLALLILIQLANLSVQHRDQCAQYFEEHWNSVWHCLLRPELPYARATEGIGLGRGQVGDTVLTLMHCCIAFGLVSTETIEASSQALLGLPAFRTPSPDSPSAALTRGDSSKPYARTSMTSISMLISLLRRVQLPPEKTVNCDEAQQHSQFDTDEEDFNVEQASSQSRLLQSVFDHLRFQVFRWNSVPQTGSAGSSFTKIDWQTEVSPLVYASVLQTFGRQATASAGTDEFIFIPELIWRLTSPSAETSSYISGDELNGFGVDFCMLERGLDSLSTPYFSSPGVQSASFSPVVQTFLGDADDGLGDVDTYASLPDDQFKELAIPSWLLRGVIPQETARRFSTGNSTRNYPRAQSISMEKATALDAEITAHISDLLEEIANKLQVVESNPIKKMRVLSNSFDVGLVLAVLYATDEGNRPQQLTGSVKNARLLPLLKHFFDIVAKYMTSSVTEQAQQSQSLSENMVHILKKFHTVILVLQGCHTLRSCIHPTADLIDLRVPSDLRSSIRTIVTTLEESLAWLSGLSDTGVGSVPQATVSRSHAGASMTSGSSSWESTSMRLSSSLLQSQQQSRGQLDIMDDGEEDDITRDRPPSRVIQKSFSLWCFRVILLLKKDSGLSAVKKFAGGIRFEPDFLLAIAVLLCGIAGSASLELFVQVIDNVAEEGTRERGRLVAHQGGSCRAPIFLSQVLSVLRIAGLTHEKRKYQQHEQPPAALVGCARKYLDMYAEILPALQLRMARIAQLRCMEVFFRLKIDEFREEFGVLCPGQVTDKDLSVRVAAARGLQTLHFMYPEGGRDFFRHCFGILRAHLEVTEEKVMVTTEKDKRHRRSDPSDPCIDTCLSVLLSLFVSACSSQQAIPEVLGAFVELSSFATSLSGGGLKGSIPGWMRAIAAFYGYDDVLKLLDDHFCDLWHRFIHASTHLTEQDAGMAEHDQVALLPYGRALLEKFPLSTLLGEELDSHAQRRHLMAKVDVIFPIGVFRSFISGQSSGGEGMQLDFVEEIASFFSDGEDHNGVESGLSTLGEQVTTDLFALAFLLLSYPDPELKLSAQHMLSIAEERAQMNTLSLSHLGHITSKMARFTVWNIVQGDEEELSQSDVWKGALAAMKAKYSEFDWTLLNLAELLCEFYVLLVRTKLFDPRALCAVECFQIFVTEIRDAVLNDHVLQQLLLLICFQSIRHLAEGNRREIGSILTLLVRESCKSFLSNSDMFGHYIGFVVREIADILSMSSQQKPKTESHRVQRTLALSADDQAKLEWVIFAICNDLGSGLGKYTADIDLVPTGVSGSLDKLNSLIIGSRKVASSAASQGEEDITATANPHSASSRSKQAQQQIETFIQRETLRGSKFYRPVLFGGVSERAESTALAQRSAKSLTAQRFSAVATSIQKYRDSSCFEKKLYGKLAHTLLYLSSVSGFGNTKCCRGEDAVGLATSLGELGALDASEYELSLADHEEELSRLFERHFHRGALRETKSSFALLMHERLLAYLCSLLFESKTPDEFNPSVVEETLKTLKQVLNLDEGVTALARCRDNELKAFVSHFEKSSPANWSSTSVCYKLTPGGKRKMPRTFDQIVELWTSTTELGFESWVCLLASCLTRESPDPLLNACSGLVAIRVDMAIFLFPYALESILRKPEDGTEPSRTAKAINKGVRLILTGTASSLNDTASRRDPDTLESLQSQPLEVVQLLVHSINFLRETEKARFVETNGKSDKPSAKKGKTKANKSSETATKPSYDCMVDVDLLSIAKAAVYVKMPYSAMQYVEMWLENQNGDRILSLSSLENDELGGVLRGILLDAYGFDSNIDGIYGVNDGRTLNSQLVKYSRENQFAKAVPLYDVSLQFSPSSGQGVTAADSSGHVEGMLVALQSLGYKHLLEGYLQGLQQSGVSGDVDPNSALKQTLEHKYELAWKNMQWEAVLPRISSSPTSLEVQGGSSRTSYMHQHLLFQTLRAIAHRDFAHLKELAANAKEQILESAQLSLHSFESTKDSYTALAHLQSIHEIEELADHMDISRQRTESLANAASLTGFTTSSLPRVSTSAPRMKIMPLLNQWRQRYGQIRNDFDKMESLLSLEEVLLQVSSPSDDSKVLAMLYLDLASISRKAGRVAIAYRALLKLGQLEQRGQLDIQEIMQWKLQKAKLLWSQQEGRSAIWTAKKLSSEISSHLANSSSLRPAQEMSLQLLQVSVLTMAGKWIASQRSESSQTILENYFQKATDIMNSMNAETISERVSDAAKANFALAEFMASMYQQVNSRVTSREWLAGKKVMEARHEELKECQTMDEKTQLENRAHILALNKEVFHDLNERSKVEASVDEFLVGALCSYGRGLTLSPRAELDMVFRVLSLWFNNQNKADINRVVAEEVISSVPSYKFVPLSYQIISRVSTSADSDTFQTALRQLVLKLGEQHPHHTLIQLIALKNSSNVEGKGALQFRTNVGDAKAEGAKVYLEELKKTEQRELLESLDIMASAYVQLALFDTRDYHGQKRKIPLSKVQIYGLNPTKAGTTSFDHCLRDRTRRGNRVVMPAVLTSRITPQPDMDYSSVARMLSFEPMFSITDSGIHRPKIIYCYGSDGQRYKQLVKGQDDTRQDLVIEQVFDTMNQFLEEEHSTCQRKLRLRTYRVVPLSPIAGVLEWVENTTPWGSYLVARSSKRLSAHERYHPHEWKHAECRQYLKNASNKLEAYMKIQENFTPVFHHFFLEKFPDPVVWYHRRLAYVQSAAVTSIVGYILGIGDRHSQNILIHEETGELVHIDFGVVFDQGMALFTPETVPFRLTRDMVDGMGVSGVDGVFSRCCEVTLQLLRKKSASVVTILEVFVHDPLYRWTLSPLKALRIQEGDEDPVRSAALSRASGRRSSSYTNETGSNETQPADGNKTEPGSSDAAARALIRVKQKLEGYEDPNGNALSIEGQVKHLLNVAQDPHNLSVLFPGWAPWL